MGAQQAMQLLLSAKVRSVWVEVEGFGAASMEHDDIGVERLIVAERDRKSVV